MRKPFLLALAVSFLLAACTPPYRKAFDDAKAQNGWTNDQELAAFGYADRVFWAKEDPEGSGKFVILYSKIPTAAIDQQLAGILTDFDQSLDPHNADMTAYVKAFNLQKDMQHEEAVTEVIYTRVHADVLETQFQQDLGNLPTSGPEADLAEGYDAKRIFLAKNVAEAFPFKSEVVEAAKKNGTLIPIEHLTLDLTSKYDHKEQNPNDPDDANDFLWKPKSEALDLTDYKIITSKKPGDNHANYIEGYRIVDGKKESKPCIKIFFPSDGSGAVVVLDKDRQGEPGYGVPDILEQLSTITNAQDIIRSDNILQTIFPEKKAEKRAAPPDNVFKIEISRIGQTSQWEKCPNASGWAVPFRYRDPMNDNYNIRIKYVNPDVDPNDPAALARALAGFRTIQYISKEYTKNGNQNQPSDGAVIEYYRPKPPYDGKVKAKVNLADFKQVEFIFPDGSIQNGLIVSSDSRFIESTPYAISFNEGSERWLIEKSAGSSVYDERRLVSPPDESVGDYSDQQSDATSVNPNPGATGPADIKARKKKN